MPSLKVDWATRHITEMPNPCLTPASLYNLCDLDWVLDRFQDDLILDLVLRRPNHQLEFMPEPYQK